MTPPSTLGDLLNPIKERVSKATPGPWRLDETIIHGIAYGINGVRAPNDTPVETLHNHGTKSWSHIVAAPAHAHSTNFDQEAGRNMQFIASSRTDIEKLIKCVEVLEGALKSCVGFEPFNSLEPRRCSEALVKAESILRGLE